MSNATDHLIDCAAVEELIADYAFGLTSAAETQLVERGLKECPDAARQLADYRRAQDDLLASVPQVEPPTRLRAQVLSLASGSPQPKPQSHRPSAAWILAAAALFLLALVNVYWISRVNVLSQDQADLLARLDAANSVPTALENSFVLTNTSDLRTVRLPPSEENSDATAILLWNAESGIGLLYVQNFPQPKQGNTYQLWFTKGEDRLSGGTFTIDAEGKGVLLINITRPIDEFTWSRITEEPLEGSPQPGQIVLVNGQLQ
jgi:anti-sigma-K factor RskA